MEFGCSLCLEQVEAGRYFLHEYPDGASSWQEECILNLLKIPGVGRMSSDQCQLGAEVMYGKLKGHPIRKRTGFLSNGEEILKTLSERCTGKDGRCSRRKGGVHAQCAGRIARDAARYPPKLCRAIVRGMIDEMKNRGIHRAGEEGLHAVCDEDVAPELDERYSGKHRDDISGQVLRDDLVREARQKELEYFCAKGVWVKRPKNEARQRTGKGPISVRWVDVNKGDDINPRYRSRLVAPVESP